MEVGIFASLFAANEVSKFWRALSGKMISFASSLSASKVRQAKQVYATVRRATSRGGDSVSWSSWRTSLNKLRYAVDAANWPQAISLACVVAEFLASFALPIEKGYFERRTYSWKRWCADQTLSAGGSWHPQARKG